MRKTRMWILVVLVLVLAVGLWWLLDQRLQAAAIRRSDEKSSASGVAVETVAKVVAVAAEWIDAGAGRPEPGRRTAWRMVLAGDRVELLGREDLQGDFHERRGRMAWLPGMLLCRLLDARQQVLAEETLAAPDHACVVQDPQMTGEGGQPMAVAFSSSAPVVFQVRLPRVANATQLQVYRLTGPRPAAAEAAPAGILLGRIALSQ
ncbi:MAG: hypothetical protein WCO57_05390 [Verrucomicrobiota bacterium]